jgi:hypothetical protein
MNLDEIVEFSIKIMKSSLRILGRNFDKYLIPFLQMVIQAYKQNHLPGFIYAVEFCLSDYQQMREYDAIFQEAFNHITEHTITRFLVDQRSYDYEPEVAYDYFGMCARLLKTNKVLFFSSPYLEGLLNTWGLGIGTEHPEASQTHEIFISHLLSTVR